MFFNETNPTKVNTTTSDNNNVLTIRPRIAISIVLKPAWSYIAPVDPEADTYTPNKF
ncbi:11096_t:CDS:2 [Funneliformis caledonium]|uniref:11096_t:CDS:1 n=1 Tax=Funneliformis caledonium TaxID=1117310 RepID=A0A9N9A7D5_9GLOM|nr:11096_t:CDS:2 [Funneliformis caledonium]